jgi:hypothetical protein
MAIDPKLVVSGLVAAPNYVIQANYFVHIPFALHNC